MKTILAILFLTFFLCGRFSHATGPITAVNLTNGSVAATGATTASVSPGAYKLDIATAAGHNCGASGIPTVTGGGQATWTQFATIVDAGNSRRIVMYRALSSTPTSGTMTVGGNSCGDLEWSIDEFSNIDISGANGAGAIVQSVTNTNAGAPTTYTITMAALSNVNNIAFGGERNSSPISASTAGSGFTALANIFSSGIGVAFFTEWKLNSNTVTWGTSGGGVIVGIAVEIRAALIPHRSWVY